MSNRKPCIAITMGDPAGIGPEIIVKMFKKENLYMYADVFVIGDLFPILSAQRRISKNTAIKPISQISKISRDRNIINLLDLKALKLKDFILAEETAAAGKASYLYLLEGIKLAKQKKIDAIVTAPINKHALHLAGIKEPGHTEILAKKSGIKDFAMMLMADKLKVVLVTIHTSIKSVPNLLTAAKVYNKIKLTHNSLKKDFGIKTPRIAVLGLNPHAGEAGAFGSEEKTKIIPAIYKAKKQGIDAQGPFPPDTIFHKIIRGSHDAAVCMYHDQGLIPLKLVGFDTGVNITMGLPFVRTSPDHGTAYDIVGTGKASEKSIRSAFNAAIMIAGNRKK
jgi:4-hydroxythreonine-4-phosphate dehydrogenase